MTPSAPLPPDFDVTQLVVLTRFQELAAERMLPEVRILADNNEDNGNVEAWQPWALDQKVLTDVSTVDTRTTVLGQEISLPVIVAPFALQGFVHPDGEVATGEGVGRAGTTMALSLATSRSFEDVGRAAGSFWVHLQFLADRDLMLEVITEAKQHGARAVCLTVDLPVGMWWPEAERAAMQSIIDLGVERGLSGYLAERMEASSLKYGRRDISWDKRPLGNDATWLDFEKLRSASPLPIVVKGVLSASDARLAVEHGAEAIVVSNHGGHGLAQARPTAEALPEIVDAVAGRLEVLVDGGIRDAADVYRAVAMGARAVLIGRRALWGLALGGADGVAHVLKLLRDELEVLMGMTGVRTVAEIDRSRIVRRYSRW